MLLEAPPSWLPHLRAQRALRWAFATILLTLAPNLHAQGCSQCLDSTRATPPQVQGAYRHAIYLLGGAGLTFFIAGGTLLLRNRN